MIRAEKLVVGYGGRTVVTVEHLEVLPGQITVVIGPNASGKSTLVRCLAQSLKPEKGHVLLDERDLYRLPARIAARAIAYVPQSNPAPFAFTVGELVGLGVTAGSAEVPVSVEEVLRLLDLSHLAERSLTTLSGGEQQRAAAARAFAQGSPHLLLDEPTAHLDLRHQTLLLRAVWKAVHEQNKAALMVLHDLNLAAQWGDYFVLLAGGGVLAQGRASEVLTAALLSEAYQTAIEVNEPLTNRPPIGPAPDTAFTSP